MFIEASFTAADMVLPRGGNGQEAAAGAGDGVAGVHGLDWEQGPSGKAESGPEGATGGLSVLLFLHWMLTDLIVCVFYSKILSRAMSSLLISSLTTVRTTGIMSNGACWIPPRAWPGAACFPSPVAVRMAALTGLGAWLGGPGLRLPTHSSQDTWHGPRSYGHCRTGLGVQSPSLSSVPPGSSCRGHLGVPKAPEPPHGGRAQPAPVLLRHGNPRPVAPNAHGPHSSWVTSSQQPHCSDASGFSQFPAAQGFPVAASGGGGLTTVPPAPLRLWIPEFAASVLGPGPAHPPCPPPPLPVTGSSHSGKCTILFVASGPSCRVAATHHLGTPTALGWGPG